MYIHMYVYIYLYANENIKKTCIYHLLRKIQIEYMK